MARSHGGLNRHRWALVRRAAFARARWRCQRCGRAGRLECHHVLPLEQGGAPYDMANLQALCRGCHISVHKNHRAADMNQPAMPPGKKKWVDLLARP